LASSRRRRQTTGRSRRSGCGCCAPPAGSIGDGATPGSPRCASPSRCRRASSSIPAWRSASARCCATRRWSRAGSSWSGDGTAALLGQLSELDISLALGDFGTGCAPLGYLERLPIRRLKIGRAVVQDIGIGKGEAGLARATIAMAHCLGVDVVAEGIETLEQLAMLRRYGCDEGQGCLLGRPVVAAEVPALLQRRQLPQLEPVATASA
jgi:hypothetical protein